MKKAIILLFIICATLSLIIANFLYSSTRDEGGIKKAFCTKILPEQMEVMTALYEVNLLKDKTVKTMTDHCVYSLEVNKVLYGRRPSSTTIQEFLEGPYGGGAPSPLHCKDVGKNYFVLVTKRQQNAGIYGCGGASIHSMERKEEIVKLLKLK